MAMPIRPRSPLGMPSASLDRFQVRPPSSVANSPEPGPPDLKNQGQRRNCHIEANSLSGLRGSIARSAAPVRGST